MKRALVALFLFSGYNIFMIKVHFTIKGILTSFAETLDVTTIDHKQIRSLLNDRIAQTLGAQYKVREIFFIEAL